jgi:hypothetical protein
MVNRYKVKLVSSYKGMDDLVEKINSELNGVTNELVDIKLHLDTSIPGKTPMNTALIIIDTKP